MAGQPTSPSAIAAAVIVAAGRVLMVRRRVAEAQLSWQFPAGAIEDQETATQAAVRETVEETGLRVTPIDVLGSRVHPATGRHMTYVACQVEEGTATVCDTEELAELAWCDRSTLAAHVPYPFFEPVAAYLDAHLAPSPEQGTS
ncbi:NUDIX hydrolase [Longispora sp. K20-0274]|uniref:NUDIX hydrolase n=1 Tax=Longispora sp. K20-0274 TaxID=3088255 RepID=UPI0039997FB7